MNNYIPKAVLTEQDKEHNDNLKGEGGVFNNTNLQLYHYSGNNSLKYVDPTGEFYIKLSLTGSAGATASGGLAIGFTKEKGFQIGLYGSAGGGSFMGMSASAGAELGVGAGNISDMDGISLMTGGSGTPTNVGVSVGGGISLPI